MAATVAVEDKDEPAPGGVPELHEQSPSFVASGVVQCNFSLISLISASALLPLLPQPIQQPAQVDFRFCRHLQ